jgi:hypothetical protein
VVAMIQTAVSTGRPEQPTQCLCKLCVAQRKDVLSAMYIILNRTVTPCSSVDIVTKTTDWKTEGSKVYSRLITSIWCRGQKYVPITINTHLYKIINHPYTLIKS